MLCTLNACSSSTPLRPPPPIATCGSEALDPCEPPVAGRGQTLGESDLEDADNRERWRLCILRHNAAVRCLRAIERAGLMDKPGDAEAPPAR
jgi:hypothetical protein